MLAYLRARAFSRGFLGGSQLWMAIGLIVWTVRLFQWLDAPRDRRDLPRPPRHRPGHPDPPPRPTAVAPPAPQSEAIGKFAIEADGRP